MAEQNGRSSGEFIKIDFHFLPIKLHYFLLLAALGAVMSFMQVLGKGLGINATAVGIIFTILHFSGMLAKPAFGALIDHFGIAVGGLIGGFAFDELGGHRTFLTSALVSVVCTLSFCVIGQVFKKMKK